MTSQPQLLPTLKAADWPGSNHPLCYPLAPGLATPNMPWVAFGCDHPQLSTLFSDADSLRGLGIDHIRGIIRAAMENLLQRPACWQQHHISVPPGQPLSLLVCTDDCLAAEHILNRNFVRRAHVLLSARILAVAVPRRGLLLAMDAEQPRDVIRRFVSMAAAQFSRAETEPITPLVFLVDDGDIVGAVENSDGLARSICEIQEELEIFIRPVVVTEHETGEQTLQILAGGSSRERLARSLVYALPEGLHLAQQHERFTGTVTVLLMPELTPPEPGLVAWMQEAEQYLNGLAAELWEEWDVPIPVSVSVRNNIEACSLGDRQDAQSAEEQAAAVAELDTAGLIKALRDKNVLVRRVAIARLSELHDPQLVGHFIVALADQDDEVCSRAVSALADMGETAVPPLLVTIQKGAARLREYAICALALIDAARFVDIFVQAMQDPAESVRRRAIHSVRRLKNPALLEPLLAALTDQHASVRTMAIAALRELGDPRAVEPLIEALRDRKRDVRMRAAFALGELRDRTAVEPLVKALRDDSALVRAYAAQALRKLRDQRSIPALLRAVCDQDEWVMRQATNAIMTFGTDAVPAIQHTRDRLDPKRAAECYRRLDELLLACSNGFSASLKRGLRALRPR